MLKLSLGKRLYNLHINWVRFAPIVCDDSQYIDKTASYVTAFPVTYESPKKQNVYLFMTPHAIHHNTRSA